MPQVPSDWKLVHPARAGSRPMTAEDLWRIPRVGTPVPLPGGERAVVPVTTYDMEANVGTSRLWIVDLRRDGSAPRALTSPHASSSAPAVSPDGSRVAFLRKEPGEKKQSQVYVIAVDGGEAERICEFPLGAFDVRWMPNGAALIVGAHLLAGHLTVDATTAETERREKDPVKVHTTEDHVFRFWDRWLTTGETPHLFLVTIGSGTPRDLMPDSTDWFSFMEPAGSFDICPDGSELVYGAIRWDDDRQRLRQFCHRLDLATGERRTIAPVEAHSSMAPRYGKCGRSIVFGQTYEPDFYADRIRLFMHDRETGATTPLLTEWEHSPDLWVTEDDGSVLLQAGVAARTELLRIGESDEPTRLAGDGTISGAHTLGGGRAVFVRQHLSQPAEVHVLEADGEVRRVTHFTDAALEGIAFGAVHEVEQYHDGERLHVQMFVLLPPLESATAGPPPLVQVVHGGPHGTSADSFHPRWNAHLFAAPGYVVATPNFHGSTTWGQDFAQSIQGEWGDLPHGDVMAATDLIVDAGVADESRMAIAGGSYGGYLTSWVTSQTQRFRCAVNHAGVFDTQGMFASDVIQGRHVSLGGRPWDDHENLDHWNPLRQSIDIATPTLVIHGEKDYRVPVTQGLLCYSVLRNRGIPARLVHFPDENHWVLKPRNSVVWYREVHDWFARFLGEDTTA